MRKPFVAGNWKMHTNGQQAEELARAVVQAVGNESSVEIAVCPPFPYLLKVAPILEGSNVSLGAQNVYPDKQGAYTGEVSPMMLIDCSCKWVLVGHSERRHLIGETDDFIRNKMVESLSAGLQVVLCVGETLALRESNQTDMIVESQLSGGLERLTGDLPSRVVIAYEPVWAIGTGRNATPEQAEEVHQFIRDWLDGQFGKDSAENTRILYGGSVKPGNASDIMAQPNVDGLLVGGASLVADDFTKIVESARS